MESNSEDIVIGMTSSGMIIFVPLTFELVAQLTRKDLAETRAMFEYLYASPDKRKMPLLTDEDFHDVFDFLETIISISETKSILKTKSFHDLFRYGRRLVFSEYK